MKVSILPVIVVHVVGKEHEYISLGVSQFVDAHANFEDQESIPFAFTSAAILQTHDAPRVSDGDDPVLIARYLFRKSSYRCGPEHRKLLKVECCSKRPRLEQAWTSLREARCSLTAQVHGGHS